MKKISNIKNISIIISIAVFSSLVLYLPFFLKLSKWFGLTISEPGMLTIYKHFDGPLYIIPAKTLYDPKLIESLKLELPLPAGYFAAHLPLYSLLIRLFSAVVGYLHSPVAVNLIFSAILAGSFYFIVGKLNLSKKPLILALIFLFLPRFLVIRSIGAPESLFVFLILFSLYFFERQNYFLAGIFGGLATMTKTPGILLFAVFCLAFLENFVKTKKFDWHWLNIGFIPLGLILVFLFYFRQYGDFFAYFHSGDNIHLVSPFAAFNFQKTWVGTAWLEDIIFYFFIYLLTIFQLKHCRYRSFFYFSLVFYVAVIFVQHRDISRYSLPLWPLGCIAFENFLTSKKFLAAFIILLPAIYLYAWNFLLYNTMPIANWLPFL